MERNTRCQEEYYSLEQLKMIATGQADPLPLDHSWRGYSFYAECPAKPAEDSRPTLRATDMIWALKNLG